MSSLARIYRFHFPAFDFGCYVTTFAEQAYAYIILIVLLHVYGGLAIVDEYLDHVLVKEYTKIQIFTFLKLERRLNFAHCQDLALWLDGDRKTLAILIAEYADAIFFGAGWLDCDTQLDSIAGNIL